ncbi:MAG: hypothetical protein ABDH28_03590 [Brevinematia bacterium]
MQKYREISTSIENLIKNDTKARALYNDMLHKSKTGELEKLKTLHPFITYTAEKVKQIYGNVDPKELKRAIIYFYSKNFIGIDIDLWK